MMILQRVSENNVECRGLRWEVQCECVVRIP